MIRKTIHFIAGMPRSGSTLLTNILAQNPRFQVTATSGILDMIVLMRRSWEAIPEFRNVLDNQRKLDVLRSMLRGYFEGSDRPVAFDKSRSWLAYLELAEALLQRKAKVLVNVRTIPDVLASFEKLWQKRTAPTAQEKAFPTEFQTLEGRCRVLMREDQVVGIAYTRIKDALLRGFRDRMHFISFEGLTAEPARTVAGIYTFLGEPAFAHDFEHVEPVTSEDDGFYGLKGLHDIRPCVRPVASEAAKVLGPVAEQFHGNCVWDEYL
jgi:sulfotransferase